jgi:K+-transporting ATPase ATPase C chain
MRVILRPTLTLLVALSALAGLAYPIAVTGAAQLLFPVRANGSLLMVAGTVRGSRLIGQHFVDERYFRGRPSATSPRPYDGTAGAGSNLAPSNPELLAEVEARIARLRRAGPEPPGPIPGDLVTASGSGLDPDISPAAGLFQVRRVAKARGVSEAWLRAFVERHVERRLLGFIGEPRVNVLELNAALDGAMAHPSRGSDTGGRPHEPPPS